MASEDIGNADPQGLVLALAAWDIFERLGSPEGELAIAQVVVYLACAPKSNAIYTAFNAAREDAATQGSLEVPMHLRNAPTRLMKEFGHGKDYRYAHDEPGPMPPARPASGRVAWVGGTAPVERGLEAQIAGRLRIARQRPEAGIRMSRARYNAPGFHLNPISLPRIHSMFRIAFLVLTAGVAVSVATSAQALDMPKRKSGLWELKTTTSNSSAPRTMQMCVDEQTDDICRISGRAWQEDVQQNDLRKEGNQYIGESVCSFGGSRPPVAACLPVTSPRTTVAKQNQPTIRR
jgi:hypothetical protein